MLSEAKIQDLVPEPDAAALRRSIEYHLKYTTGKDPSAATLTDWRLAVSRAVRDLVIAPWFETTQRVYTEDQKRVYYLSMEFLIGRLLEDAILNLGLDDKLRSIVGNFDVDYAALLTDEPDAALGNGGLGRLAACFMDSMSTVGLAAYGYGIRYNHGLFRQSFENGWQAEEAEDWLRQTHPWEFERPEAHYPIGFGGAVSVDGAKATWTPAETVLAVGYDTPVPGWRGRWSNTLRLWSAKPEREFDLEPFNRGDYMAAAAPSVLAETISRVLYPDDTTAQGKELRLKQEYFFTAASLADIVRRFLAHHDDVAKLPQSIAIQLNDTHPAIACPELVRLLMDHHGQPFETAFEIARGCLHYTNHTLMPEALERWPTDLMGRVLPRHMALIERIDDHHAKSVKRPESVKILDGGEVRMGDLAFIGARRVNGVSALHTELMKQTVFKDLHELHPERVVNQTNGVTPRRWLYNCNPALRSLLNDTIGETWVTDLDRLEALLPLADDTAFRARFAAAKDTNKRRLADHLKHSMGITLDPTAMFDIQIKRIHEYKRQLMNILHAAALWNAIRQNPEKNWAPRIKIFGGKAAPGYVMAKLAIKLINDIGATINKDPAMAGRLQIVYPPNYNVSMAELLIPAADLSEQISTAGMEASGTGNMKLSVNGALTVGTLDGANIEIGEAVGSDNIFIFGLTAAEVAATRAAGYDPASHIAAEPRLAEILEQIASGAFSPDDPGRYTDLVTNLREHDWFMVAADFSSYWDIQSKIDEAWHDRDGWHRSAVLNTARMGWFSSDRTIRGYARDIWNAGTAY
ncbi:glycogen/starch/alpha-glucan phosphorylase [Pelagibius litoralis]|uniref:Alpha-1,4 glucan phosphorylase n=1 Tax=Pelagibius litoralis TaxID=374515 RepID=A0A967K9K9_9PROT|nr:glycogen/starch/alpha-glucan phosphorylase [Pelagibius litoralis]NIA69942.1 glycogen/starch/alpha-glucan phosphorylase [Pelagibius litoralis]